MKARKYTIPELSAISLLSLTNGNGFHLDISNPSNQYLVNRTRQDDCPMFYQAMCVLHGDDFNLPVGECDDLSTIFVYLDFSGVFNRNPIGKVLEWQKRAEAMFSDEGIYLDFGKGEARYLAFERSASMSRNSRISFIRADFYEPIRERMLLGMNIGLCQLSKLYAYNGLLFTGGERVESFTLSDKSIILIDNPKSGVKEVPVITVVDDGTENSMRKYTRVETKTDVEVTEFDGEGLVSSKLAQQLDHTEQRQHHSFQIRMPYIKGVVHEVDFKSLFTELGITDITDIFGVAHNVNDVDLILTKSMFKGFGWMKENGLSFAGYLARCCKYRHALYISGRDSADKQALTELNYQLLNTAALSTGDFRPTDLPLGWTHTPNWESRNWLTKATETQYWNYVGENGERSAYFIKDADEDSTSSRTMQARLIQKNALYINEPMFAKELTDKAEQLLSRYALGKLLVSGDNRYLSDDLMRLLAELVKGTPAYEVLQAEFLVGNTIYAPQPAYAKNDVYTLLRNPHIARNEEAKVIPLKEVGKYREKYLSHLRYVVMVDSRSLIPDRLGGADYDGDLVKTVSEPLVNHCLWDDHDEMPLLKIPSAEPLIRDANDWFARFLVVKSTFSSRVGQISNAALHRSVVAYDENSTDSLRDQCRKETEILAILTGLEIDSAKSGIKPDLSEYLTGFKGKRTPFLRYKYIADGNEQRKWYQPTQNERLKKYYDSVNWNEVSSNLERLPYLARELKAQTVGRETLPVSDSQLFTFANEQNWKERLNKAMLSRMEKLIADYEETQHRCRYLRVQPEFFKRKNDVQRILFSQGKDAFLTDELYRAFDGINPWDFRKMRLAVQEIGWIYTPPERRSIALYAICPTFLPEDMFAALCDFRNGGFRILGNIVCDYDDMYSTQEARKHLRAKKRDSKELKYLLSAAEKSPDYRAALIRACRSVMQPPDAKEIFDFTEAAKCAIALGKRQFAIEVLPSVLLELTVDRSHIYDEPEIKKRGWFGWLTK